MKGVDHDGLYLALISAAIRLTKYGRVVNERLLG